MEEVARIHGYDQIPEDVSVPVVASRRSDQDRVLSQIRGVLSAAGLDEALTASIVSRPLSEAFSPWTDHPPLVCHTPLLRGADCLRRSLVPSLLEARRTNQSLGNPVIELLEIARVYLPRQGQLPDEKLLIGIASGGDYFHVKGILERLLAALHIELRLEVNGARFDLLDPCVQPAAAGR